MKPSNLKLILTVGASGCGKTTWCNEFRVYHPFNIYINPDSMRYVLSGDESDQKRNKDVFFILGAMCEYEMLFKHSPILIDATNTTVQNRSLWIKLAKKYNYEICAKIFTANFEECVENNERRERKVPVDVISRQFNSYVSPTKGEGFDEIDIVEKRKMSGRENQFSFPWNNDKMETITHNARQCGKTQTHMNFLSGGLDGI